MEPKENYTVNVSGDKVNTASGFGYHAYYANGVTAVEIPNVTKAEAHRIASQIGKVLYIFI